MLPKLSYYRFQDPVAYYLFLTSPWITMGELIISSWDRGHPWHLGLLHAGVVDINVQPEQLHHQATAIGFFLG